MKKIMTLIQPSTKRRMYDHALILMDELFIFAVFFFFLHYYDGLNNRWRY